MDRQQIPSLKDLAKLHDSTATSDRHPETKHAALWLIREVPEANAMWEELNRDPGDRPSPMELAKFVFSVTTEGAFPESEATARWLIRRLPAAQELFDELVRLQKEAGPINKVLSWRQVLEVHAQFDRLVLLLLSGQDWADPNDVLDGRRNLGGVDPQALYNICVAQLARANGHGRETFEAVKRKLEDHLAEHHLGRNNRKDRTMNNESYSQEEIELTLEDLAIIVSKGHIESELQQRLASVRATYASFRSGVRRAPPWRNRIPRSQQSTPGSVPAGKSSQKPLTLAFKIWWAPLPRLWKYGAGLDSRRRQSQRRLV